MAKVVVGLSMSLDGFVSDKNGDVSRLYPDFEGLHEAESLKESIRNTGAVVLGKRSYAMGDPDWYADNYEYQVPIFVLTHEVPPKHPRETDRLTFTYVADGIESIIAQAKAAAGDKEVTVIGASTIQQCIRAGLADEIDIYIAPVLLGEGLRLFEHLGAAPIELETLGARVEVGGLTQLRYRIVK